MDSFLHLLITTRNTPVPLSYSGNQPSRQDFCQVQVLFQAHGSSGQISQPLCLSSTLEEAIMRPFLQARPSFIIINQNHSLRPPASRTLLSPRSSSRSFTTTPPSRTSELYSSRSNPHRAYYQTHGRALFKCLTLAFLTYQIVYWTWLTLETEEIKEGKNREVKGLEGELRLLEERGRSHPAEGRESMVSSKEK